MGSSRVDLPKLRSRLPSSGRALSMLSRIQGPRLPRTGSPPTTRTTKASLPATSSPAHVHYPNCQILAGRLVVAAVACGPTSPTPIAAIRLGPLPVVHASPCSSSAGSPPCLAVSLPALSFIQQTVIRETLLSMTSGAEKVGEHPDRRFSVQRMRVRYRYLMHRTSPHRGTWPPRDGHQGAFAPSSRGRPITPQPDPPSKQ